MFDEICKIDLDDDVTFVFRSIGEESIYYGKPLEQYLPKASAGVTYRKLAKELISYEG